jgi:predicted outer membrane repeat protein
MPSFRIVSVFAALLAHPQPAHAAVLQVPADEPTIQAGLEAASPGDTVVVACGVYLEHDLVMKSGVALRSATGDPGCVTVDAQQQGRGILCVGVDASTKIAGITFANGFVSGTCPADSGTGTYCMGGGMLCVGSSPEVADCVFSANHASDSGGGVACLSSSPTFTGCLFDGNDSHLGAGMLSAFPPGSPVLERCVFAHNSAVTNGGAVYVFDTSLTISRCTLFENAAPQGGSGIFWISGASLDVESSIVAFGTGGAALLCGTGASVPFLACSDIFGNAGGNWIGCIAPQRDVRGNFDADPLFCDADGAVLTLSGASPCAPSASGCGLVGALSVGCGPVALEALDWGRIAAKYRGGR